ncbi:MAG TPA: thermonuclease family protein [Conexibacter sp.]|jgi:endonuclease YncB( thermonuclease family)
MKGRIAAAVAAAVLAIGLGASSAAASPPRAHAAAVCADYPNQAAAQQAADTIDADGDGLYCESLPCPCSTGSTPPPSSPPPSHPAPPPAPRRRTQTISAQIIKVVDGDTLDVKAFGAARSRYRVRLIGIDTPERYGGRECGAAQATGYMQRIAWPGRKVTLHTDPTQDTFDRYDRLLAYVDVGSGSFQSKMLTTGLAKVYVYGGVPFQRVKGFEASSKKAKRQHRGAWGMCRGNFHRRL